MVGFVLVASPEPMAIRETLFFHQRLTGAAMPFAGFVVNRVHADLPSALPRGEVAARRCGCRGRSPPSPIAWPRVCRSRKPRHTARMTATITRSLPMERPNMGCVCLDLGWAQSP